MKFSKRARPSPTQYDGPICVIGYNQADAIALAISIKVSNPNISDPDVDVRSFGTTSVMPDIQTWAFKTVVVIDSFPSMSLQEMRVFCWWIEIWEANGATIETVKR